MFVVCLFVQPAENREPVKSQEGPLGAETADGLSLKDSVRKKELPDKVFHPENKGPYPSILFSHGFGGNQEAFGPEGCRWAMRIRGEINGPDC